MTCEARFSQSHQTSGIRVTWILNNKTIDKEGLKSTEEYDGSADFYLMLPCDISNFGNLVCVVSIEGEQNVSMQAKMNVDLSFPVPPKITETQGARVNGTQNAVLSCSAKGYPPPNITWSRSGDPDAEVIETQVNKVIINQQKGVTSATSKLEISNTQRIDNGTYVCHASSSSGKDSKAAALHVVTNPKVTIDYALGVGNGSIYLNWTLDDGNLPILKYSIKYMKDGTEEWRFSKRPDVSTTHLVIDGLEPDEAYFIQMEAENAMGRSHPDKYQEAIKTLSSEVEYIPVADVKGSTSNSFTLGWTAAPEEIRHLIGHYFVSYKDSLRETTVRVAAVDGPPPVHLFIDLQPATVYTFKVRACQRYTDRCGNFSELVNGTTLDGAPSVPRNVAMRCGRHGNNHNFYVNVSWDPPSQPNGHLVQFSVF